MAKTVNKLLIMLGDGATPEVFTSPCALASRSIKFTAQVQEDVVFGCPGDDPDDFEPNAAWVDAVVTALSASVTGSGKLAADDLDDWWSWINSAQPRNIRVHLQSKDKTTLKTYFSMSALLTDFELGQEGDRGLVDVTATIRADGAVTKVTVT